MTNAEKHQRILSLIKMAGYEKNRTKFSEKYGIPYRTIVDWCMGTSWASEYLMDFLETTIRVEIGTPFMYRILDLKDGDRVVHKTAVKANAMKTFASLKASDAERYKLIIANG